MIEETVKVGVIFLIFLLVLTFIFLYLKVKKIERLSRELERLVLSIQKELKSLHRETSLPSQKETMPKEKTAAQTQPESLPSEIPLKNKNIVRLPILVYHHIDFLSPDAPKIWQDLTVRPETFEKQMEYLFQQNYQPITFRQFFDFIERGGKLPEKSLIITFDDGWKNQYQYAFPILKKYNFPATFFIVVNYVGGDRFISWAQLKELLDNGMEIGSHSMSHPNLKKLNSSQLIYEIKKSKTILEKNLDCQIEVFAYPYGLFDSRVVEAVWQANYKAARTTIFGLDQDLEKMYTLKSIHVYDSVEQLKNIFPSTK